MPQNTKNILGLCFLFVSGTKGLKIDEKRAKFAKLAKSVPRLSENVSFSHWKIYFEEKSTKVPHESRNDICGPWNIIFTNWQI
jgi:hypothetical protein